MSAGGEPCASGRHAWMDPVSRARCCNGWHREFRVGPALPSDDALGRTTTEEGVFVWVPDGVNRKGGT